MAYTVPYINNIKKDSEQDNLQSAKNCVNNIENIINKVNQQAKNCLKNNFG